MRGHRVQCILPEGCVQFVVPRKLISCGLGNSAMPGLASRLRCADARTFSSDSTSGHIELHKGRHMSGDGVLFDGEPCLVRVLKPSSVLRSLSFGRHEATSVRGCPENTPGARTKVCSLSTDVNWGGYFHHCYHPMRATRAGYRHLGCIYRWQVHLLDCHKSRLQ